MKRYATEIIGAFFCLALGIFSGYLSGSGESTWYLSLTKPALNPPGWIFPPVWTTLYLMMGVALGKLWKNRASQPKLLALFFIQLFFNFIWSPLFFYYHQIQWALVDIALLWISLLALIIGARQQIVIVLLLLPYLLWVSFAAFLNWNLYQLNWM